MAYLAIPFLEVGINPTKGELLPCVVGYLSEGVVMEGCCYGSAGF
jgi:hypothetical protein